LQRAEQKIETLESRITEQSKAMSGERALYEERLAKLKEQLEAEQAARAFAEGALQAARQERGVRRQDAESTAPKDPHPAPGETGARKDNAPARLEHDAIKLNCRRHCEEP